MECHLVFHSLGTSNLFSNLHVEQSSVELLNLCCNGFILGLGPAYYLQAKHKVFFINISSIFGSLVPQNVDSVRDVQLLKDRIRVGLDRQTGFIQDLLIAPVGTADVQVISLCE